MQDQSTHQPRRVLLSGSSGLIGSAIATALRAAGDVVTPLVRHADARDAVHWSKDGQLEPAHVSGYDAVIHLAGEPVASNRWTGAKKHKIRESRVTSTQRLVAALRYAEHPPRVLICASGINVYGDHGDKIVDESTPAGEGFLAKVCTEWEAAANGLSDCSRVVSLRIGVVLTPTGGSLAMMLPFFRYGLAGPVAGGNQYVSWISLADSVRAIEHILQSQMLRGPVNLVSLAPVMGKYFVKQIAAAVHRHVGLPVPAWIVRLLLGQLADETVLTSIRAVPRHLLESGFVFRDVELSTVLEGWHLDGR